MDRLNPSFRAALGNDRKRLLDEMVTETILLQEARRRGLDRDPEVQKLMREARRQILLGRFLEILRQSGPPQVSEEEVTKFYNDNPNSFKEPETFRASHILVESEEQAKKALERLKAGESFAAVAQELSTDPTKSKGGDIGYFSKGQLLPEFEAACEKLKPGELSGVVKTSLGHHIIYLSERRAARQRPLEEVKDQIQKQLAAMHQQRQVESYVQDLRARAQVKMQQPSSSPPPAAAPTQSSSTPQRPNP